MRAENALTFVADMDRSYIPHPAVPLEAEVDALRKCEPAEAKPLHIVWRRPSGSLRIEAIDDLEQIVAEKAHKRITGRLPTPSQFVVNPHHHPKAHKRLEETH